MSTATCDRWTTKVPAALRDKDRWVLWRHEERDGKKTKVPYKVHKPSSRASTTDPQDWDTFAEAVKVFERLRGKRDALDGIGYVFAHGGFVVGIDLDNCLEDGKVRDWSKPYLRRLHPTYVEVSPSGKGLKLWVGGELPGGGTRVSGLGPDKDGAVEVYDSGRFFTVTGDTPNWGHSEVEDRSEAISEIYRELKPLRTNGQAHEAGEPTDSDEALLARARAARNGAKFRALYDDGELPKHDHSQADYALCCRLAFWFNRNRTAIDRVFRKSALMRDKWDEARGETTYGAYTIAKACDQCEDVYTPPRADTPAHKTDLGNAERLVARHGAIVRYCHDMKTWLVWDERRWAVDRDEGIRRLAKDTVRSIYAEASRIEDEAQRKALASHAHLSESKKSIAAMIELARMDVPVLPEHLDTHPWLLNLANGTLDLKSGMLGPHRKEEMITRLCDIEYDPHAICPKWLETLNLVFKQNAEIIAYFQQLCGIALTGDVSEQYLYVLYGTGSNGKSTVIKVIQGMLGPDYACVAPAGLMVETKREEHPTLLMTLRGVRLMTAVETSQDGRLNEERVKRLTGGDEMNARGMRENYTRFTSTAKCWLATNHKPTLRGTDHAIRRRVKLIPFLATISDAEAIKDMPERLSVEYPGILAWCVRGLLARHKAGRLVAPKAVEDATKDYIDEQDMLGRFIEEKCTKLPQLQARRANLFRKYLDFAKDSGEKDPMSQTAFGYAISALGINTVRVGNIRYYDGIGINSDEAE